MKTFLYFTLSIIACFFSFKNDLCAQINLNQYEQDWTKEGSGLSLIDLKADNNGNNYSLYYGSSGGVLVDASNTNFPLDPTQQHVLVVKRNSLGVIDWVKRFLFTNCMNGVTAGLSYNRTSNKLGLFLNYSYNGNGSSFEEDGVSNQSLSVNAGATVANRGYYAVVDVNTGINLFSGETFSNGNNFQNAYNIINDVMVDNAGSLYIIGDAHISFSLKSNSVVNNFTFSGSGFYLAKVDALGNYLLLKRWEINSWYTSAGRNKRISQSNSTGRITLYAGIYSTSDISSSDVNPDSGVAALAATPTGACNGRLLIITLTGAVNYFSHVLTPFSTNNIHAEEGPNKYVAINISAASSATSLAGEVINVSAAQASSGNPTHLIMLNATNGLSRFKSLPADYITDICFNVGANQLMVSYGNSLTKTVTYLNSNSLVDELSLSEQFHSLGLLAGHNNLLFVGGATSATTSFDVGFGIDVHQTSFFAGSHVTKYNRCSLSPTFNAPDSLPIDYLCGSSDSMVISSGFAIGDWVWTSPSGVEYPNENFLSFNPPTPVDFGVYKLHVKDDACVWSSYELITEYVETYNQTVNYSTACEGDSALVWLDPFIPNQNYSYYFNSNMISNNDSLFFNPITIQDTGDYRLSVIDQKSGCVSRYFFTIDINQVLIANDSLLANSNVLCANDTLELFSPFNSNWQYSWSGPNGWTSSVQNPVINNPLSGSYVFVATDQTTGCQSLPDLYSNIISIVVNSNPIIDPNNIYSNSQSICENGIFQAWTDSLSGFSYSWSGPNGFTSAFAGFVINDLTTLNEGGYLLTITDQTTGCISNPADSVGIINLTINSNPNIGTVFLNDTILCANDTLELFSPFNSNWQYSWSGPNGWTSSVQNPVFANLIPGVNNFVLLVVDSVVSCSSQSAPISVFVNANPNIANSVGVVDSTVCIGDSILLYSSVGNYFYSWSGPNGWTSSLQNPVIAPASISNNGIYTLTITDQTTGCSNIDGISNGINVSILNTPVVDSLFSVGGSNNNTFCIGDSILLYSSVGNYFYSWSGPNGWTSSLQNPVIAPASISNNGIYTLTITDQTTGCFNAIDNSSSIGIIVNSIPVFNDSIFTSSGNNLFCEGGNLTLFSPFNSNWQYSWSGPNGWTSSLQNPVIAPLNVNNQGLYSLVVTDVNSGCSSVISGYNSVLVSVDLLPNYDLVNAAAFCYGDNVSFGITNIAGANVEWIGPNNFSSLSNNNIIDQFNINNTGDYTVTISSGGCVFSEYITLSPAEYCSKIPEIVTPNGDGLNDEWELSFLSSYPNNIVHIFNRWGTLVFKQNNYMFSNKFEGIANVNSNSDSKKLPNGTYYYLIDLGDGSKVLKGFLELLNE